MANQEKLSREEILKELDIPDDTLSLYEHELEMDTDPNSSGLDSFTSEDLQSIRMFHKLRESGLTYNEIKLLTSFSELLKSVDFEGKDEVKNLLKLSPVYRLKQSLNLTRQELNMLKTRLLELEKALEKEIENKSQFSGDSSSVVQAELTLKQKAINSLDRKLSEVLLQKTQLESELTLYKVGQPQIQIKGKKAKELYQTIIEKEAELLELRKKNEELLIKLNEEKEESAELMERLDLAEDEISEMEHEIEERYQEQIDSLRGQIESLINKKQKEWESFYTQSSDMHRKELLASEKRREQEVLRLKQKIKEQIQEIDQLKTFKNPLLDLLRMGSGQR
ncbi:MAG: hypothetical protein HY094_04390 [Candidatus Melainabacteria bacterium]|nr:hypothetical protein [Candidatus Melainabacteria bacterium]